MREGERGQSELLGFLLIFVVVVLTIALVITTGFVGFNSAQDYQRSANAEQAFTVLASNIDDVVRGHSPSRVTEIRLADATLSATDGTTNVTIDGKANPEWSIGTGSIVYDTGTGTSLSYHSGALIREDDGSAVMLREPDFVLTDEEIMLPVIDASFADAGSVGGTTSVTVRTRRGDTAVLAAGDGITQLTVELTTPHPDAWRRYFEQFAGAEGPVTDVQTSADGIEVTMETDRLYLTLDRIHVSFR